MLSGSLAPGTTAAASVGGGNLSKFHRSYSMGQGWASLAQHNHPPPHHPQQQHHQQQQMNLQLQQHQAPPVDGQPKVVYRRRNNSTSEGDGSLLICYPSEHLRRLVPQNCWPAFPLCRQLAAREPARIMRLARWD